MQGHDNFGECLPALANGQMPSMLIILQNIPWGHEKDFRPVTVALTNAVLWAKLRAPFLALHSIGFDETRVNSDQESLREIAASFERLHSQATSSKCSQNNEFIQQEPD